MTEIVAETHEDTLENSEDPCDKLDLIFLESREGIQRWVLYTPESIYISILRLLRELAAQLKAREVAANDAFMRLNRIHQSWLLFRGQGPIEAPTIGDLICAAHERSHVHLQWAMTMVGKGFCDENLLEEFTFKVADVTVRLGPARPTA